MSEGMSDEFPRDLAARRLIARATHERGQWLMREITHRARLSSRIEATVSFAASANEPSTVVAIPIRRTGARHAFNFPGRGATGLYNASRCTRHVFRWSLTPSGSATFGASADSAAALFSFFFWGGGDIRGRGATQTGAGNVPLG